MITYRNGEWLVHIDDSLIGFGKTYDQALAIQSNARLARADHRHITYDDLLVMRAAGTFAEYLTSLDADGLSSVAHILVAANHAAGNLVEYTSVLASLVAVRDQQRQLTVALAEAQPAQVLIVAEYSRQAEQIVIRRGWGGPIIHYCNTWIEVEEYKNSIGTLA
jgi:hypothetical protein